MPNIAQLEAEARDAERVAALARAGVAERLDVVQTPLQRATRLTQAALEARQAAEAAKRSRARRAAKLALKLALLAFLLWAFWQIGFVTGTVTICKGLAP